MKKTLKRISVLILALAMVFAMGITAFGADTGVTVSSETTVNLTKSIIVYNDEATTVYGPGIVYDYTIAKADSSAEDAAVLTGKTVTDKAGNSITVKNGVTGGVTLTDNQASFTKNATVSATSTGTEITDTITATVNLDSFTAKGAGVYRYVITETVPATLTTVGITRPENYYTTRYLDVYIKNGTSGLEVQGYVCFIGNDVIDAKTSANNKITGKTTGFVDTYDSSIDDEAGSAGTGIADKYYTYNYTITKTIKGDLADKTHPFPFEYTTAGAVTGQQYTVTTDGTLTAGVSADVAAVGTSVTGTLADGQTITIKGLPANTTFNVTETNDTADIYKVSIVDTTAGTKANEETVNAGATKAIATASQAISDYATNKTTQPTAAYTATTFTNKLEAISPTGVVVRYAPYALILAAGIVLFGISRRRKANEED